MKLPQALSGWSWSRLGTQLLVLGALLFALDVGILSLFLFGYQRDVGRHLDGVGTSRTPREALARLDRGLAGARARGLTTGIILRPWPSPDDDVGRWYQRLSAARIRLAALDVSAPSALREEAFARARAAVVGTPRPVHIELHHYAVFALHIPFGMALVIGVLGAVALIPLGLLRRQGGAPAQVD